MKKQVKKLVLAKETVVGLELKALGRLAGGTIPSVECGTGACGSATEFVDNAESCGTK